jgi:cytoskeleton-associated protein 5
LRFPLLYTVPHIFTINSAQYGDDTYEHLSNAFEDPSATIVYPYVYRILNTTVGNDRVPQDGPSRPRSKTNGSVDSRPRSPPRSQPHSRGPSPSLEEQLSNTDRRRNASVFVPPQSSSNQVGSFNPEDSATDPDERLLEIINHISEGTSGALHQQGITELHHFLKAYPHKKPRVDRLLEPTGPAFRKYLARALASRAADDEERDVAVADTLSRKSTCVY